MSLLLAALAAGLGLGALLCCADLAANPCRRSAEFVLWIAIAAAGIATGALASALYAAAR